MSEAVLDPTPQQEGLRRFRLRALFGLCAGLAAAAGVAAYLGISQRELIATIHDVALEPLLLAAAGGLILMSLQALRWWVVMRPLLTLTYGQAYRALMVGFAFNVLLPARGGDLLRVQYLGKRAGVSRAKLLGTEIVDFWSDKWGWVAAFPLVCVLGTPPAWLFRALLLIGGAVIGVGALLALMGSGMWREQRMPAFIANLRDGFAVNHWKRLLVVETLIAPLPWLWETFVIALAGHALGLELTPMQAFAALTAFNVALPNQNQRIKRQLKKSGLVRVECDAHGWMLGWVYVADNPYYAVTATDGTFTLANVPPGSYTLVTWQEYAGEAETPVSVKAKEVVPVTVELKK